MHVRVVVGGGGFLSSAAGGGGRGERSMCDPFACCLAKGVWPITTAPPWRGPPRASRLLAAARVDPRQAAMQWRNDFGDSVSHDISVGGISEEEEQDEREETEGAGISGSGAGGDLESTGSVLREAAGLGGGSSGRARGGGVAPGDERAVPLLPP